MRITLLGVVFLAACGGTGRGGPDASGTGDAPSGGGATCGGVTHLPCGPTEYCDYADNGCGIGDRTGTCRPRPAACPASLALLTCGCDGRVYGGDCGVYMNGVDLNAHGTCDVPQGLFACGYVQCSLADTYCERTPRPSTSDAYTCLGLPPCTGAPSCACLGTAPCGNACTGNATVGLTLTCPPGP